MDFILNMPFQPLQWLSYMIDGFLIVRGPHEQVHFRTGRTDLAWSLFSKVGFKGKFCFLYWMKCWKFFNLFISKKNIVIALKRCKVVIFCNFKKLQKQFHEMKQGRNLNRKYLSYLFYHEIMKLYFCKLDYWHRKIFSP